MSVEPKRTGPLIVKRRPSHINLKANSGFFIQRNELNGHYAVMMVPKPLISDSQYIQYLYIPADVVSGSYPKKDYDYYSIVYVEPNGIQWHPPEEIFKKFQICDSVDGINFNYVG